MSKEITFDKFIRWAGIVTLVIAVLYITNYLSEVLLPFFIAWFFAYLLYPYTTLFRSLTCSTPS